MKNDDPVLAILYCVAFTLSLLLLELVVRKLHVSTNISRRLAHIGSGLFGVFMWISFTSTLFLLCNGLLILFIVLSHYKKILISVHGVKRKTYGEVFLPIGILLTFTLASNNAEVFIPAILIMTLADACAGIVGDLRAKGRPSNLGSVVFFVLALLIFICAGIPTLDAIGCAFVVMVVEKVSPFGSDNLTVPIAASVLLLL